MRNSSRYRPHKSTEKARERVLKVARKRGYITNQQARAVGRWQQAWYHLHVLAKAGLLKREGFNMWVPR